MTRRRQILVGVVSTLAISFACGRSSEPEHEEEENAEEHADSGRVMLTEQAMRTAEILVEPAISEVAANAAAGLEVPGEVHFDPRRVAVISPRVDGRVEQVRVVEGDRVRAGDIVATVFTPTFVSAQTEYLMAVRRAATLAGTQDAQGAQALVDAAGRRLRVLGASAALIDQLGRSGQVLEELPVHAPFDGSIVEVTAVPGSAIDAGSHSSKSPTSRSWMWPRPFLSGHCRWSTSAIAPAFTWPHTQGFNSMVPSNGWNNSSTRPHVP